MRKSVVDNQVTSWQRNNQNSTAFLVSRDTWEATTGGRPRSDAFYSFLLTRSRHSILPPASDIRAMIVFAGSFLCVGIFFVLAGRRTRKLTENAEDLHGSARWADEDDIRDTGLLTAMDGVYVGGCSQRVDTG